MRRLALPLVAAVALGVTGCDHGSKHHQAAPRHESVVQPAPSPYSTRMVQRAFALAHLPLAHDRVTERFAQGDVEDASGRQILAAFLTDETGNVQVSVYRPAPETNEPTIRVRAIIEGGAPPTTTKTLGNVEVTYPKPGSDSPLVTPTFGSRVLVALAMLRSGYDGHEDNSRYRQGTDSTGAAYCVMYDHDGASGSVREGACPTH